MKRTMFFLCGMLVLCGCEAVKERQLTGYWMNRNGESSLYSQKVLFLTTFEEAAAEGTLFPEEEKSSADGERFAGIYRTAYLADGVVAADSVLEGRWRIEYAPSKTANRSVYALDLAPSDENGAVQRFEISFDGDRLILADFQQPEITVERFVRVGVVAGIKEASK